MTVNKIIEAVSAALYKEFGNEYFYYQENIKQEFNLPCFYIKPVEPYIEQGLDRDKKRINKFVIHFMPKENGQEKKDINEIYERLIWALDYVEADGKIYKGTKKQSRHEDGVLLFFVNFDYHIRQIKDKNYMESLKQNGGVKNG